MTTTRIFNSVGTSAIGATGAIGASPNYVINNTNNTSINNPLNTTFANGELLTHKLKREIEELIVFKEFVLSDPGVAVKFESYKTYKILKDDPTTR